MHEIVIFVQVIVCFECGLEKTCTSEFFKDYQVTSVCFFRIAREAILLLINNIHEKICSHVRIKSHLEIKKINKFEK